MTPNNSKPKELEVSQLLPCPFCGSSESSPIESVVHLCHNEWHPEHNPRGDWWTVQCDNCTATMGQFDSPEGAVNCWNTRLTSSQPVTGGEDVETVVREDALNAVREIVPTSASLPDEARRIVQSHLNEALRNIHRLAALQQSPQQTGGVEQRLAGLRGRFADAVAKLPWVAERIEAGQQFNAYDSASNCDDDEDEYQEFVVCIGPISDHRLISRVTGRAQAELLENALKIAALSTNTPKVGEVERDFERICRESWHGEGFEQTDTEDGKYLSNAWDDMVASSDAAQQMFVEAHRRTVRNVLDALISSTNTPDVKEDGR